MINKRLIKTSSNPRSFNESRDIYQKALEKANHKHELKWNQNNLQRNRRRNPVWLNPPWSNTIKTNIGREFLRLVDKWFVSNPNLKNRFNRMTIKVPYSTTRNMKSFIVEHNKKILNNQQSENRLNCNCTRSECPIPNEPPPNNCRQSDVIYEGKIVTSETGNESTYKGCT